MDRVHRRTGRFWTAVVIGPGKVLFAAAPLFFAAAGCGGSGSATPPAPSASVTLTVTSSAFTDDGGTVPADTDLPASRSGDAPGSAFSVVTRNVLFP